jgi:hypothetical protein
VRPPELSLGELGDAGGQLLADKVEEGKGRKHLAVGIRRVLEDR